MAARVVKRPLPPKTDEATTMDSVLEDDLDIEVVATFSRRNLGVGFVDAFVAALRTGVEVQQLVGADALSRAGRTGARTLKQRRDDIRARLKVARTHETNATDAELKAKNADDRDRYGRAAARAHAQVADLEYKLEQLRREAATSLPTPAGPFHVINDVIVPAMKRIRTCRGVVSREEYQAFKTLVPRFELVEDTQGGHWTARAWVRLPTNTGVAILGPIEWEVGAGGRGAAAHVSRSRKSATTAGSGRRPPAVMNSSARRSLKALLRELGLNDLATSTVAHSMFPELPQVLSHAVTGDPLPTWVAKDWHDPKFIAWVKDVYTDPNFVWHATGQYSAMSPHRQLLAYYATEHATFTSVDVFRDLPVSEQRYAVRYATVLKDGKVQIRDYGSTIVPVDGGKATMYSELQGVKCKCGRVADIVTRIPEIPRDLLCSRCLRMPDVGASGVDPDMQFPKAYRVLQLSREFAHKEVSLEFEAMKTTKLGARSKAVLALHELLSGGATERALAEGAGVNRHLAQTMPRLEKFGYVKKEGRYPAIWSYTDEGLAYAVDSGLVALT